MTYTLTTCVGRIDYSSRFSPSTEKWHTVILLIIPSASCKLHSRLLDRDKSFETSRQIIFPYAYLRRAPDTEQQIVSILTPGISLPKEALLPICYLETTQRLRRIPPNSAKERSTALYCKELWIYSCWLPRCTLVPLCSWARWLNCAPSSKQESSPKLTNFDQGSWWEGSPCTVNWSLVQ